MGIQQMLMRSTGPAVALTPRTVADLETGSAGPVSADASITFSSTGELVLEPGGVVSGEWLLRNTAADYEIRATMQSGTNWDGAALATWVDAATSPAWGLSATANSPGLVLVEGEALVEIRAKATTTVVASALIGIEALAEVIP